MNGLTRKNLMKYVGKGTQRFIGTFKETGSETVNHMCNSNTIITAFIENVQVADREYAGNHVWIKLQNSKQQKLINSLKGGETIYFEGEVREYTRENQTKDFGIECIENLFVFNPEDLNVRSTEEKVLRLYKSGVSNKHIACRLNLKIKNIHDILRDNKLLNRQATDCEIAIANMVSNLYYNEGFTPEAISKLGNKPLNEVYEILNIKG